MLKAEVEHELGKLFSKSSALTCAAYERDHVGAYTQLQTGAPPLRHNIYPLHFVTGLASACQVILQKKNEFSNQVRQCSYYGGHAIGSRHCTATEFKDFSERLKAADLLSFASLPVTIYIDIWYVHNHGIDRRKPF